MAFHLNQDWNGHKAGSVVRGLSDADDRARAEPTPEAAHPVKADAPAAMLAALKAQAVQDIKDLGGATPHPNTGLAKLNTIITELAEKRNAARMADD
jgi:hypothetical protein